MQEERSASQLFERLSDNKLRGARELALRKWEEPLQDWEHLVLLFLELMIVEALASINILALCSRAFWNSMKDAVGGGSQLEAIGLSLRWRALEPWANSSKTTG